MSKTRALRRFEKALKAFTKADEKEQKKWISSAIKAIENGEKVSPLSSQENTMLASLVFTEEETRDFSEPFKTVFESVERVARCTKTATVGGGFVYKIYFRRYGYKIIVENEDLLKAKQEFIERARVIDDEE